MKLFKKNNLDTDTYCRMQLNYVWPAQHWFERKT